MTFTVYGRPQPQGSMKSYGRGFGMVSDNPKLDPWRKTVAIEAKIVMRRQGIAFATGAVALSLVFYFKRPKSAPNHKRVTVKPDLDKLCRAIGDALSKICYNDDAQIVELRARKFYSDDERCEITVSEI